MKMISIDVPLETYEFFEEMAKAASLSVDELSTKLLAKGLEYREESEKLKKNKLESKRMSQDDKEFQELSHLISYLEGYVGLRIIPVNDQTLFTLRSRLERIFVCVREKLPSKK